MIDEPFSRRTAWPSKINKLNAAYHQLKKDNVPVIDLTLSNPTRCGFSYLNSGLTAALAEASSLVYDPDPKGTYTAREAVSRYYAQRGADVVPEDIVLTSSTSEAYSFLFRLLLNENDKVLLPRPGYPLFSFLAGINDAVAVHYDFSFDDNWSYPHHDLFENACRAKAAVIVNPNNPTGHYAGQAEMDLFQEMSRTQQFTLISDEVFYEYALHPNKDFTSGLGNKDILTFVLGGISKTLGLPQMKLSWIAVAGPEELRKEALKRLDIISDTYLSVNTPVQTALPFWMEQSQSIQQEILDRVRQNYQYLSDEIEHAQSAQLLPTHGGWYAVVRVPRVKSEEEWVMKFLTHYHVFVHPGYFFDFDREAFIVLSLLPQPEYFQEGVMRILSRMEQEMC